MIRLLCENQDNSLYFGGFESDPFLCRIQALYKTYGTNQSFADFWVQLYDNMPVSLISRLDSAFILTLTKRSCISEISEFLNMLGAESVICDGKYRLDIPLSLRTGPILACNSLVKTDDSYEISIPSVKEAYELLRLSDSKNFLVPPYESFALDLSHKLKHGTSRLYGIKLDGRYKACIMTLAENFTSAVLGGLTTHPEHRGAGLGSYLIKYANNTLINEGKTIYFHRAPNENIEFYSHLGFKVHGKWNEYKGMI